MSETKKNSFSYFQIEIGEIRIDGDEKFHRFQLTLRIDQKHHFRR